MGHHVWIKAEVAFDDRCIMSDSSMFDGGGIQLIVTEHQRMNFHDVQGPPLTLRKTKMTTMELDVIAVQMCLIGCWHLD